ncbi:glyoxalase superfamily protein [Hoeflea sp. YIM 152468]|uniref:glyoxalase superfamily protein n=1 Tax=Hoeflea sp. YIM 152468 TaxID=3031759 RepID=UPI0023DB695E|nr:glyoxalase superfamily protein [Hoeflea sp. YIM 152468]MDF1609199.1 glyoxalase superfamily protein [Hoeflea sp. YIM 152468]
MRDFTPLPNLSTLKDQARRLRTRLESSGETIGHSKALELIAAQYGYNDWNTLYAAIGNRPGPESLAPGSRVSGAYLGQPFTAKVVGIQAITSAPGHFRVSLDLDEAIDVVTFDSFSAFRKRVNGVIGKHGTSSARTSNGRPQLEISWS